MLKRLMARVLFWVFLVTLFLFAGLESEGWPLRLLFATLSAFSISGLVSAHLSEWKVMKFQAY
jgi:hypothetical protein